jgi:hypothetical protein
MESAEPAPNGIRYEGYDACLRFWQELIADPEGSFEPSPLARAPFPSEKGECVDGHATANNYCLQREADFAHGRCRDIRPDSAYQRA